MTPHPTKALTVRQPWAWLLIHGPKDIENRTWNTNFRGRVWIHAAKGMTLDEYDDAFIAFHLINPKAEFPAPSELQRGGIIGSVEIVDCVTKSDSPWFVGPFGFVLRNPQPIEPIKATGALGFWNWRMTR